MGFEARCSGGNSGRVSADRDSCARHDDRRSVADVGGAGSTLHADPVAGSQPERAAESWVGDLHADDRNRPGEFFRDRFGDNSRTESRRTGLVAFLDIGRKDGDTDARILAEYLLSGICAD